MSNPYATKGFPTHAIAVIGMAGRFPGAPDIESYRRLIANGVDAFQAFSDAEMDVASVPDALRRDPAYVRGGVHLADADMFDAGFFGMSPREAQILDPQHRLFLECCWEALETAGYAREPAQRAVGVYAGCSMNTYLLAHILRSPQLTEAVGGYQLMLANDKDFLCTRASYQFDLRGPSMTLQTACSTSLVAVVEACRALARGECDIALAGGVSITFPQRAGYLYQESMILSPDGRCRPFDADARGTRPGAGAGIVVLKRLADALADRDSICGVIRGAAVNNDGAAKAGFTAPSVDGQVEAIVAALALAATPARSIGYIETHGTGTPLGDPIEIAALKRAFRIDTSDVGFCRLGAVKANLGHLDAAAGVAGLIKALLVLRATPYHRWSISNASIPRSTLSVARSCSAAKLRPGWSKARAEQGSALSASAAPTLTLYWSRRPRSLPQRPCARHGYSCFPLATRRSLTPWAIGWPMRSPMRPKQTSPMPSGRCRQAGATSRIAAPSSASIDRAFSKTYTPSGARPDTTKAACAPSRSSSAGRAGNTPVWLRDSIAPSLSSAPHSMPAPTSLRAGWRRTCVSLFSKATAKRCRRRPSRNPHSLRHPTLCRASGPPGA